MFAALDPASVEGRLLGAAVIAVVSAVLVGVGLALVSNYRGSAETLARIGGARSDGMVRFGTAVNRIGGAWFLTGGVIVLVFGLNAAITGDLQFGCDQALICA